MKLEQRGVPAVAVVTEVFDDLADRMAEHNKRPDLPVLVLPYPMEHKSADEVREIAREHYPLLLKLLGATDG